MKEEKKLVEIKSIEIQIGRKSLTLSPEEARDLKAALDKLYPEPKVIREYIPPTITKPYPVWPDVWYKYTNTDNTGTYTKLLNEGLSDNRPKPFYQSDNVTCYCSTN